MRKCRCYVDDFVDVLVLHHVHHRKRAKKTADICFVLSVEDTHTVSYSLKKLVSLGVVVGEKVGKEVLYSTTESGQRHGERYRQIRETCLLASLANGDAADDELCNAAKVLRALSGPYDQAARAASSL